MFFNDALLHFYYSSRVLLTLFVFFILADKSKTLNRLYHTSGLALAVLTPAALVLSPSPMNMPIDLALGVIFPLHAHVGLNYIISDYVPKASRTIARSGLMGFTVITCAGLLRLNLSGSGLTHTIKSLWIKKDTK
jgi:succinate dehydrogenase (ubiquinone) membrane anchor subunit